MNLSRPFIERPIATVLLTLGIAIFGGLVLSQLLTLFTTPVIYLWFDRLGGGVGRMVDADADEPEGVRP